MVPAKSLAQHVSNPQKVLELTSRLHKRQRPAQNITTPCDLRPDAPEVILRWLFVVLSNLFFAGSKTGLKHIGEGIQTKALLSVSALRCCQ